MSGSRRRTQFFIGRRAKCGLFIAVTTLAILLAATSNGSERSASLGISITILPDVELSGLPAPVQRLAEVVPGYERHWVHARQVTMTDPVHAIRLLRSVHAQVAGETETANTDAMEADMFAAGQALFHDFHDLHGWAEAGSALVAE